MQRQNNESNYSDQRPIKGNSSGKYNMNFIDPNNDISGYYNGQLPQLDQLIEKYFQSIVFEKNKKIDLMKMCQSKKFTLSNKMKNKKDQQKKQNLYMSDHCSVCTQQFKDKQQIKILPCRHNFHKQCIKPWFDANYKCPNCRFSLYEEQNYNLQ